MTLISFLLQKVKSVEGKGARVVRIKKEQGVVVQGCNIYVGRKVSNGKWNLHQTMWSNPFDESPEGLIKYENYIRTSTRHWHCLDYLEGRLLGCWCGPGKCHGDVLVRLLEEKKCEEIRKDLTYAGLHLSDAGSLAKIRHAGDWWGEEELWLTHATRLDDTNIFYYEPSTYELLATRLKNPPETWTAVADKGFGHAYYVVGTFDGAQRLGPFDLGTDGEPLARRLDPELEAEPESEPEEGEYETEIPEEEEGAEELSFQTAYEQFSLKITPFIRKNSMAYHAAMSESGDYLQKHRLIARCVGSALAIDMRDHDLSKSRLIQVALAYCWHWPEWAINAKCDELTCLAMTLVKRGHCEKEDHHPEYEMAGHGKVDSSKLFADRIAVHLQKDPRDALGGWGVAAFYIPHDLKDSWDSFRLSYGYINLYNQALDPARRKMLWKRNRFEEDSD